MEDGHNFGSHGNHKVVKELQMTLEQCGKCSSELQAIKNQKIVTAGLSYMPFYKYRLCSNLTSFRIDCMDLLAVQGTLKSHLQHHSPKASILWHSAYFIVQLSHPYTTTGKTTTLTINGPLLTE